MRARSCSRQPGLKCLLWRYSTLVSRYNGDMGDAAKRFATVGRYSTRHQRRAVGVVQLDMDQRKRARLLHNMNTRGVPYGYSNECRILH